MQLMIYAKLLAEYIIHLAGKCSTVEKFKKKLAESGAEFPVRTPARCFILIYRVSQDSFAANLLRIIHTMKPRKSKGLSVSLRTCVYVCVLYVRVCVCTLCSHVIAYTVLYSDYKTMFEIAAILLPQGRKLKAQKMNQMR